MNKFLAIGIGAVATFASVASTFAATVSGSTISLESGDITSIASSYTGLGTSILNFITDIGPVVVPLVAALWIGSKLMGAFKGRM